MKAFTSRRAQAISAEYAVAVMVAVAAVAVMSVYIKRAFQAKAYDAQGKAVSDASAASGLKIDMEYEPYYTASSSNTDMSQEERTRITSVGFFNKEMEMQRNTESGSAQLSPSQDFR